MVYERISADPVDVSLLSKPLFFQSDRVAKNRFMKAAMTERISSWDIDVKKRGIPTERIINMYEKWGKGGSGVILTGNVQVDPEHLEGAGNIIISKENDCEELRQQLQRLAQVCKSDGSLAIVQLSHAGRQTPAVINRHPYSASDIQLEGKPLFTEFAKPIGIPLDSIQHEIIDRFVYAAKVVHETGFDGVELHGAHGYLLSQFMSPTTNRRTDKYGGTAENRVRIVLEIFDAIRAQVPRHFIIGIKMNSVEFQDNGLKMGDAKHMCSAFEERKFDFVELSGGSYEKLAFHHVRESTKKREAFFLEFAEELRNIFHATKIYVTGGFRSAAAMVRAIENNSTDGIGLGRPIAAEPDLPNKILNGEVHAAADNKFDQNDYGVTSMASASQMARMGRTPFKALQKGIHNDIPDFSRKQEAENYMKQLFKYAADAAKITEKGVPVHGVLEYEPLY